MGILVDGLIYAVAVLTVAFISDIFFGEPPVRFHPVSITGKIAEKLTILLRYKRNKNGKKQESEGKSFLKGVLLVLIGTSAYIGIYLSTRFVLSSALDIIGSSVRDISTFLVDVFFLKTTFSVKLMTAYAESIYSKLTEGDIDEARKITSHIVSRNTKELGEKHIASATIESLSENFVDGFLSPLFYFSLFSVLFGVIEPGIAGFESVFGPAGAGITSAIIYRSINTLDSMVGYRSFGKFGMPSAKLDDILTFIPARISSAIIIVSAHTLRMNAKGVVKTILTSKGKTPSPNSWIPMSAFSGALQVKLEKKKEYSIGDDFGLPSPDKIKEAVKLFYVSSTLGMIIHIISLLLFHYLISLTVLA